MSVPELTIVVPCYNGGRFFDQMFTGLDRQTFRDFEIIIVDDGSTDADTKARLQNLPAGASVIHQENKGLAAARNIGFKAARTEFVLPLDCDDVLEPTFLAEAMALLKAAPAQVAFVYSHIKLTGGREGVHECDFDPFDQLFLNELPYCLLMRKSAWAAIGGYDETMRDGYGGYADWDFNIHLLVAGYRAIRIDKPMFIYWVRTDGMLVSLSAKMHGTIWHYIRKKYRDEYRLTALCRRWNENRSMSSAVRGAGLLFLATVLPLRWFDQLFYALLVAAHRRQTRAYLATQ
ncbi:glycosyltransferase family 2 protein [Rhodoplanes sp. Z2-YC6860]|uniref:glycosyltransferase family 2 protein n=1 Tax=Rhodoplanes sp. Z2-YC6860 TaxID=674703 RepID=UPI00078E81E0|nr:glycosyltransferase family A protein [Rhodoplanes sp. Z2-YC6860]AMN43432.1 glycosyl transferase family 2 [Rhodoplanes sp. Z2-YC6860]